MFLTALCTHLGVVSGDCAEFGGEEFPAGSPLDPEVVVGRQPGALGFRAESPDALGAVVGTRSRERRDTHFPTGRP